jgi:hypothetical protein
MQFILSDSEYYDLKNKGVEEWNERKNAAVAKFTTEIRDACKKYRMDVDGTCGLSTIPVKVIQDAINNFKLE